MIPLPQSPDPSRNLLRPQLETHTAKHKVTHKLETVWKEKIEVFILFASHHDVH